MSYGEGSYRSATFCKKSLRFKLEERHETCLARRGNELMASGDQLGR